MCLSTLASVRNYHIAVLITIECQLGSDGDITFSSVCSQHVSTGSVTTLSQETSIVGVNSLLRGDRAHGRISTRLSCFIGELLEHQLYFITTSALEQAIFRHLSGIDIEVIPSIIPPNFVHFGYDLHCLRHVSPSVNCCVYRANRLCAWLHYKYLQGEIGYLTVL